MARRVDDRGLSGITRGLLVAAFALGILHHIDHILRVDHSGWPFREVVTPFTFSLFAYPILLFALLGPSLVLGAMGAAGGGDGVDAVRAHPDRKPADAICDVGL